MSYLDRVQAKAVIALPLKGAKAPSDPFEGGPAGDYSQRSPDICSGLKRLSSMGVPKGVDPLAWRLVVNDTLALASAGFAAQALDLGWSALDLFGGSRARSADIQSDGLGVWLQGRRVVALTVDHAVAADTSGTRHYFNRPRASGADLLWEMAR